MRGDRVNEPDLHRPPGLFPSLRAPSYAFIDSARFLSVLAIVARHTEIFAAEEARLTALEMALLQVRSFGVLIFFLNSGFLMSSWLDRSGATPKAYWHTRVDRLLKPWLLWTALFAGVDMLKRWIKGDFTWANCAGLLWRDVFFDSYWFVPVLIFSVAVLLTTQRLWNSAVLGLLFFGCTSFYGLSNYVPGLHYSHTAAFLGYLFPLWLGVQLHRHWTVIEPAVRAVPWSVLILAGVGATFWITADGESLRRQGFVHYSVLHPACQVYSLLVLIVLIKIARPLVPPLVRVRRESYGIYLVHPVVAALAHGGINLLAGLPRHEPGWLHQLPTRITNPGLRLSVWLLWFLLVYFGSLGTTKLLLRSPRGRRLVGADGTDAPGLDALPHRVSAGITPEWPPSRSP